jgi:hypothetical protein
MDPPRQIPGPGIAFHFVETNPRFDVETERANDFALDRTLRQRVQQLPQQFLGRRHLRRRVQAAVSCTGLRMCTGFENNEWRLSCHARSLSQTVQAFVVRARQPPASET